MASDRLTGWATHRAAQRHAPGVCPRAGAGDRPARRV